MRMWMVDPKLLCRKHLLGEHVECHMFVGTINKSITIKGYVNKGLVEVHNIRNRHNVLAEEIRNRGYDHKSPLPEFKSWKEGSIDIESNLKELSRRCPECKKRIERYYG